MLAFIVAEYNIDVEHKFGKENAAADALSSNPQECMEIDEEVKICVLLWLVL